MSDFFLSFGVMHIALLVMGVFLLAQPASKDKMLEGYKIALRLIGLSSLTLGVYALFKAHYPIQLLSFPFLVVSFIHANLLYMAHLNLVNPNLVNKRYAIQCFIPIVGMVIVYFILRIFWPHVTLTSYEMLWEYILYPEVLIRIIWIVIYICAVFFFSKAFYREEVVYRARLQNYFAEYHGRRFKTARYGFAATLCISLTSLVIACNTDERLATLLNIIILILYIVMGIIYVQYPVLFEKISGIYDDGPVEPGSESDWQICRGKIISQRLYIIEGVTVGQIADIIRINKINLSKMINTLEGVNFNTFIGKLRIAEAQRIIKGNPSISMAEVASMVGYSEQSNFTRQFKAITGFTPVEFKKSL